MAAAIMAAAVFSLVWLVDKSPMPDAGGWAEAGAGVRQASLLAGGDTLPTLDTQQRREARDVELRLGMAYEWGKTVDRDLCAAVSHYRRAGELGAAFGFVFASLLTGPSGGERDANCFCCVL